MSDDIKDDEIGLTDKHMDEFNEFLCKVKDDLNHYGGFAVALSQLSRKALTTLGCIMGLVASRKEHEEIVLASLEKTMRESMDAAIESFREATKVAPK